MDLGFALGLIGTVEHHDLDLVRKTRNEFAHKLTGLSFDSAPIADWCRELRALDELGFPIPLDAVQPIRFRFETAVVFLAITLRGRRATVAHREEPESIRDVEKRLRDGSLTP